MPHSPRPWNPHWVAPPWVKFLGGVLLGRCLPWLESSLGGGTGLKIKQINPCNANWRLPCFFMLWGGLRWSKGLDGLGRKKLAFMATSSLFYWGSQLLSFHPRWEGSPFPASRQPCWLKPVLLLWGLSSPVTVEEAEVQGTTEWGG